MFCRPSCPWPEERSFTKAAKKLNISTSGLSHAIRRLEDQIEVRLLARSTRSVLPTAAGEELIAHLRPALSDVQETLTRLAGLQDRPVGRVRLAVPRLAATSVLGHKLGEFVRKYPDVLLDITTDAGDRLDIVANGFDAGIHFGDYIAQDMVAVRVSPDQRHAIVGSPDYFQAYPIPKGPRDLINQRCISFRHGPDEIYRWELEKGKEAVNVGVTGSLILDDEDLSIRAALDGAGLAMVSEEKVLAHIASGALKRVLAAAFFRVLPVLPEPAAAAGGSRCADRNTPARRSGWPARIEQCLTHEEPHPQILRLLTPPEQPLRISTTTQTGRSLISWLWTNRGSIAQDEQFGSGPDARSAEGKNVEWIGERSDEHYTAR